MSHAAGAPILSVVIVTWNCGQHARRCLAALRPALAGLPSEIIVVDNASEDATVAHLRAHFPEAQLVEMGRNAGFAAAANRGVAAARGEFVWLLNPDTLPSAGCAQALTACLRARPHAGAAGPRLLRPDGSTDPLSARRYPTVLSEWLEKAGLASLSQRLTRLSPRSADSRPAPLVSGAGLCLRRTAWRELGGLDEAFFLYGEDVDLCRRLWAAGWEVWYCGAATLPHVGGGSSAGCPVEAGIQAILSMGRYFEKHEGVAPARAYRAGIIALSTLKLGVYAVQARLGPLSQRRAAARRKVDLHRRLIAALRREGRHA